MKRVALVLFVSAALAISIVFLVGPGAQASPDVTITVNSTADANTRDSVMTLREAMLLATGGLSVADLHEGECHQVSTAGWVEWPLNQCFPLGPPPGATSPDTIVFDTNVFPRGSPATIALGSQLPALSTGGDTIDGSSAGVMVDCQLGTRFYISSDNNTIKGLQIYGGEAGLWIARGADNNTIGGSTAAERNVISDHWLDGVVIEGNGNIVKGNYIGTDAAGTGAAPNNVGVRIGAGTQNNTIGGTTAGERNVISGNDSAGVGIQSSDGNTVKGNYIGTNASGTAALPNEIGVLIEAGARNNAIGGTSAGERNVISGNSYAGLQMYDAATSGNVVKGNYIGTDAAGTGVTPNNVGVRIAGGAQNNTIGGSTAAERNVISGNTTYGVMIMDPTTDGNAVKGNYIGTNASGTAGLPNVQAGVVIQEGAQHNTIGGSTAVERNVISGNVSQGVLITDSGTNGNMVKGNYIGTNAAGTAALRNSGWGVVIANGPQNNTIGGTTAGERNVISGNLYDGVGIAGDGTNGNMVKGNYIGTDPAGTAALGNASCGVAIWNRARHNSIGGTTAGEGNIIAYNTEDGVRVWATGNTVRGNSIHSNGGKGIDSDHQPTPPVITGFGSVLGTACANCTVDVYSDDEDEGRVYEGSTTANVTGNWIFSGSPEGPHITATATDADGSTSEFSAPVELAEPTPTPSPTPTPTPTPTATPGATPTPAGPTRTLQWNPGWQNATWSGASTPEEVFACAAGKYAAAYRFVEGGLERYFPDRPDISNMNAFGQYAAFLILITQPVTCTMPVASASGATRTLQWGVGWHNEGWSGPDGTTPENAFACADGSYAAVYRLVNGAWERHFPGRPDISNMGPLNKYDALLVNITADTSCVMPVAP